MQELSETIAILFLMLFGIGLSAAILISPAIIIAYWIVHLL